MLTAKCKTLRSNLFKSLNQLQGECLYSHNTGIQTEICNGSSKSFHTSKSAIAYETKGYPEDLVVSVALGADMFDCVWPTRTAVSLSKFLKIYGRSWVDFSFSGSATLLHRTGI